MHETVEREHGLVIALHSEQAHTLSHTLEECEVLRQGDTERGGQQAPRASSGSKSAGERLDR